MLTSIADNIWSAQHAFLVNGVPTTTRMTVVRLQDGSLWVHSPIPLGAALQAQLDDLGPVRHVLAPSLAHHLFVNDLAHRYPQATCYGPPGLSHKRPDIQALQTLVPEQDLWAPDLQGLLFGGMPQVKETVWFHPASRTLILTDLCQCWIGPLAWQAAAYARISGVRDRFGVPLVVRLLTRDKAAARQSAKAVLRWPIERIVVAHNSIIEQDAKAQLQRAFQRFL